MSCANRCFHVRKSYWLCLGLLSHLLWLSKAGSSQEVSATSNESFTVEGLHQDVEVVRDRWGIHHIYAQNEEDLFFTQGFLAARDRLFQFELWRRRATGTVAEILGSRELDRDIGARLLRPRVDLTSELQNYHDRGRTIIEAFVKGINKPTGDGDRALRNPPSGFRAFRIICGHPVARQSLKSSSLHSRDSWATLLLSS